MDDRASPSKSAMNILRCLLRRKPHLNNSTRTNPAERGRISARDVVAGDGMDIDPRAWTPLHRLLLEAVAREPLVERVFVNPAMETRTKRGAELRILADRTARLLR